jgi:endonuclease/exonuclease/phosphatase family metal-dependent hydrolase
MARNISFASFNLYNFQAPGKSVYGSTVSQSDYDDKVNWTRHMLQNMDTDVIAFQELWSKSCLEKVFDSSNLNGYSLHYIKDSWGGIAVALAVRAPWRVKNDGLSIIKDFPFSQLIKVDEEDDEDDEVTVSINRFSRSIIKATIENSQHADIEDITVFACHLKAKLPTRVNAISNQHQDAIGAAISTIRRTAEAAALRMTLTDHLSNDVKPTVVLGDLNDDPRSNTLGIITEQPNMSVTARGGNTCLYSALQLQQLKSYKDIFYTHDYKNHKDVLDHILVSEEFFENSSRAKWKHKETKIWNDYIGDRASYSSDHGIIRSEFKRT